MILQAYEPINVDNNTHKEHGICNFVASAASRDLLLKDLSCYKQYLESTEYNLSDICYSLQRGRNAEKYRFECRGYDKQQIMEEINRYLGDKQNQADCKVSSRQAAFVLNQSGIRFDEIVKNLYKKNITFTESLEECNEICKKKWLINIIDYCSENNIEHEDKLSNLATASIQYAVVKMLLSLGVITETIAGYGVGALMASHLQGEIVLEDALLLAYEESVPKDEASSAVDEIYKESSNYLLIEIGGEMNDIEKSESAQNELRMAIYGHEMLEDIMGELYKKGVCVNWRCLENQAKLIMLPLRAKNEKKYWYI